MIRTRKAKRCSTCRIPKPICVCPYTPSLSVSIQFWIMKSKLENFKPTNTGALIERTIADVEVYQWQRLEIDPKLEESLRNPKYLPFIVFPRDTTHSVEEIKTLSQQENRIPAAILLDGTWREASKMFRKSEYFKKLPVVALDGCSSQSPFRSQPEENFLSTVEVAAQLIKDFGEKQQGQLLLDYFQLFYKFYWAAIKCVACPLDAPEIERLSPYLSKEEEITQ